MLGSPPPPPTPPPSRMGTNETAEFNMGASTTKGPLPLGKVLSGWGRHTTASTSGHARLDSSLRSEERRQSNRRKGEPRAAQPEPPRTSRRRSVLLPKERDKIALSAASDLRPVGRPQTTLMAEPIPGLRGPLSRESLTSPHPHPTPPRMVGRAPPARTPPLGTASKEGVGQMGFRAIPPPPPPPRKGMFNPLFLGGAGWRWGCQRGRSRFRAGMG